eukprot:TRINITY_DN29603_c0_g1_i6.p1 TRINITY_DN29603_c0_g1~~TRINITY_DN29603_c0_g1_i6.p1  ORF type:complete len:149 (+),score=63.38 TRINITY_DN29603_c0_g1_i6:684-1130(+)
MVFTIKEEILDDEDNMEVNVDIHPYKGPNTQLDTKMKMKQELLDEDLEDEDDFDDESDDLGDDQVEKDERGGDSVTVKKDEGGAAEKFVDCEEYLKVEMEEEQEVDESHGALGSPKDVDVGTSKDVAVGTSNVSLNAVAASQQNDETN